MSSQQMSTLPDPAPDTILSSLKWLASTIGPFGPWFERGMLSVIDQIERMGFFTPDPVVALWSGQNGALPAGPVANAEHLARGRGLTLSEATVFARGVNKAESELAFYKDTKCG
jgi:hypothetical protein